NMVAQRAGAPTYSSLTMDNVKKEKWFEMAWEGCRFWDLVRWGDAEKELAFRSHSLTPYLRDDFLNNWLKTDTGKTNPLTPTPVTVGSYTYYTFEGYDRSEVQSAYNTDKNAASGRPHKAIVLWTDDGYGARGGGFVKGKHELYPFPFDVVELNPWNEETGTGIKQNPGWE
ncbi:MAG: RagB/SusD family nutrient uptake outer membrane protein, partial [Bacteroidales bacterium]|nr:RagB/SusD family nutrient uptake outer membrane protein [Bacteroidales bacterium]